MKRHLVGVARPVAAATLALAFVVGFLPGRVETAVRIYALVLCSVALTVALGALRRAYPPARPLRRPAGAADARRRPPSSLARIEHEAALGVAGAFDLHHRLRPRLRTVALALLAARRRVSLDDDPESARTVLGDESWELVQRDRPPPADRLARGVPPASLRRIVESLERL